MTTKPIIISHHAAREMKKRGIDRRDVRWLLHTAARSPNIETTQGQRWQVDGKVKGRHLRVVFFEWPRYIVIISAHWRTER